MNEVTNVDFTRQPQEQGKVQAPRTSQTEMMVARQAQEVQVAIKLLVHLSGWQKRLHRTGEILILDSWSWSRGTESVRSWHMRGIWRQMQGRQKCSAFHIFVIPGEGITR